MSTNQIILGGNLFSYALNARETKKLLDYSFDKGCRSIDTADVYSNGASEELIGNSIKKNRSEWFIATKLGVQSDEKVENINSKKNIYLRLDASLKRLKTDYVDLYQLHHYDPTVPIDELLEALIRCKEQGKLLNFGVSNYRNKNLLDLLDQNKLEIYSNQIHFNIINRQAEIEYLESRLKGVNFIAYNVLGRGLFREEFLSEGYKSFRSKKSDSVRSDLTDDFKNVLKILDTYSKRFNISIPQLSLRFALENDFIHQIILGVRTLQQLDDIINVVDHNINIPWEEITEEINKLFGKMPLDLGSNKFYES